MSVDPSGDTPGRGAAVGGALVGLLLAAALLLPAFAAGNVPARGDLADFFWPMKAYTAERWTAGAPPLWNPLSGGGEPWLAQLQSGVLYPGDLPFLLGWERGAFLGIALHLALAAAGAAFWLRELGASRTAALAAAGIYAGGGAFLSLVPVYNNACTAAWLPWLFAGARRIVVGRSRGAGFALAVAAAFLAGEPALAAAGSVAALALALWAGTEGEAPGAWSRRGALAVRSTVPLLLGLCLAGAALLPFGELVAGSERRARTTRGEAVARAVGPSDLADLVAPPRPEATRTAAPGRGGYLVTLALGPLPLLLAAGAGAGFPGRRRLLGGLAVLGAGGLLLALGAPGLLAPVLFDSGLLRGLRFPARWAVFPHLALAVAAGAGLDGWTWGRFRGRPAAAEPEEDDADAQEAAARTRVAVRALAVILFLLAGLVVLSAVLPEARASRDPGRTVAGASALALGLVTLAIARRRVGGPLPGDAAFLAALAVVPLPWLAGEPLAAIPAAKVAPSSAEIAALPRGAGSGRVFAPAGQDRTLALRWRYAGGPSWGEGAVSRAAEALAGYTNLFPGIPTTGSASPIGNPRMERLVGVALTGGDAAGVLALLDVRHVLSPFPTRASGLRLEGRGGGVLRYAVPGAFGRAYFPLESRFSADDEVFEAFRRRSVDPEKTALVAPLPAGAPLPPPRPAGSWAAARFLADGPERAELATSASAPSLLVLTRSWDPGWKAKVDGEPAAILRAQLALLAVVVPPGEHRLEIAYRPSSFRTGLGLSAAGLLGVLVLALAGPPGGRPR
ncbi:MAG: YfhO family protein [Thermoanaerobaculia bacterium]